MCPGPCRACHRTTEHSKITLGALRRPSGMELPALLGHQIVLSVVRIVQAGQLQHPRESQGP